jgi:hypothetical protein
MILDKGNVRYGAILYGSLFLGFVLLIGILVLRSYFLSKEYPNLSNSDSLNDTVVNVINDGRGSARVTFASKSKFTLPWAKNFEYEDENLPRMVKEGDIISKKEKSDTIILRRDHIDYIFVAYKAIN